MFFINESLILAISLSSLRFDADGTKDTNESAWGKSRSAAGWLDRILRDPMEHSIVIIQGIARRWINIAGSRRLPEANSWDGLLLLFHLATTSSRP